MAVTIQVRRDTAANWTSSNPILANGEIGWETDTRKMKVGDGTTAWNSLAYTHTPWVSDINAIGYDLFNLGKLNFNDATVLTIASGAITITQSYHSVDTEAAAATDDLDTINGGTVGDLIYLKAADGAHTVVLKYGTGNIVTPNASDYSLDDANKAVALLFDGTNWHLIGSAGGSGSSTFIADTDTPAAYTSAAGLVPKVNASETALEFGPPTIPTNIPTGQTVTIASGQFAQIFLPIEYYPNGVQVDGLLQVDGGLLIMGV